MVRRQGRYYFGESEEQSCYTFQFRDDVPEALERSFIISLDYDKGWDCSPLDVITGIVEMWEDFFLAPQLQKAKDVMEYLQKWEVQDKIESLLEEQDKLKKRLCEIEEELEELN